MPFQLSEQHIANYLSDGYTVFRGIVPPSLVADLRRAVAPGREMARAKGGPQAQRLQPVGNFELDQIPFKNYRELPALQDALSKVVGPDAWHADSDMLGIFYEPAERPSSTRWHRDITAETPGVDAAELETLRSAIGYFNQVNCALYDDSSTWYVPGSHCRDDLPSEIAHATTFPLSEANRDVADANTSEELEMRLLAYSRDMPRAICLQLNTGDFALYRPLGWHIGNYVPYRVRATLHDIVLTPPYKEWWLGWRKRMKEAQNA